MVNSLFDKYGGVPRYVLTETDYWHESLEDAIGAANLDDIQKSVGGPELLPATSHKLLHYDVDPSSGYRRRIVRFASDYVADRIAKMLLKDQQLKSVEFLRSSAQIPTLASVRGSLFEAYAHKVLQGQGEWKVRCLSNPEQGVTTLKMNYNQLFVFDSLDKINLQEGIYYQPKARNFGAFDSLAKVGNEILLFQMTVSPNHPLHHAELQKHLTVLGLNNQNSIKLFHVVPPDIFTNFRKQSFHNLEYKPIETKNISKVVQYVEQWVLEIPLTLQKS